MLSLLSSHKLYKSRGRKIGFLQFIHDVVCQMVANAPNLNPRPPKNNLLYLTGRHFSAQISYREQAAKKTHSYKKCQFAMLWVSELLQVSPSKQFGTVLTVQTNQNCGLECFKKLHTKFDFTK